MSTEKEIRAAIEDEIGEILRWEQIAPGIYYVSAMDEETQLAEERYVLAEDNPIISNRAKAYATPLSRNPKFLYYVVDEPKQGRMILEYEAYRYLLANGRPLPKGESIVDVASFAREHHPEYFGDYPVPLRTPLGITLRYQRLIFGTFLIETDQLQKGLAVCYPIYSSDLSDFTRREGEKADDALPDECNYLVFSERSACLALHELSFSYDAIGKSEMIDFPALMNAIWQRYPIYAAAHNVREQTGYGHIGAYFSKSEDGNNAGVSPEYLISMTQEGRTDYLRF